MNSLGVLSKLKIKPNNKQNTGINIIISSDLKTNISKDVVDAEEKKAEKEEVHQIQMVEQKDDGRRAKDILERLKQNRLSGVINKEPVEKPVPNVVPIADEPKENISTKPKRAKKKLILEEELPTKEILGDNLPEGGPRLEELVPQKLKLIGDINTEVEVVEEKV
jgi:hypothetical protein